MAITRIHIAPGWGANEELTSADMTAVDVNVTNALDKRSGQTDTLASTVTVTGAMTFSNTATFNGSVAFFNPVTYNVGSTVVFADTVAMTAAVTITGGVTMTINPLTVTSAANLANLRLTGTSVVNFANTRTISRTMPDFVIDAKWEPTNAASVLDINASPTTNQSWALIPIVDIPQGATLTSALVYYKPGTGHTSAPGTVPGASVNRIDMTTGIPAVIGSAGGPHSGGTAVAYEVYSVVNITGLSLAIDHSRYRYTIEFFSETGTNALDGLTLYGAQIVFNADNMDQV